jgi:hypothetical protein
MANEQEQSVGAEAQVKSKYSGEAVSHEAV